MLNECVQCGKSGAPIRVEPNRHACSPNSINWSAKKEEDKFYLCFCSKECEKIYQDRSFAFWAELDRNASDAECFSHIAWDGKMRIGKCKVTGEDVRVEPLQPGDNSGQPVACYEHFVLRKKYKEVLETHA